MHVLRAKNILTCQRALHPYVLTCQRALHAYMATCQRVLRAHVLTCFACLRASFVFTICSFPAIVAESVNTVDKV